MFSFLKKDPLHKELKRAKKIKKAKEKWGRKERERKRKTNNRILTFLSNKICPECGHAVRFNVKPIKDRKDIHFKCTEVECSFEKHYYCGDI